MAVVAMDFGSFLVYVLLAYVLYQAVQRWRRPRARAPRVRPPTTPVEPEASRARGRIDALWVYPLKSARGVSVQEAVVGPRGFVHDRHFVVVTPPGSGETEASFCTLRTLPRLAHVQVAMDDTHCSFTCDSAPELGTLRVSWVAAPAEEGAALPVRIWSDHTMCTTVSAAADQWFESAMRTPVRLARIGREFERVVPEEDRAKGAAIDTSLSDGFPYLLVTTSSLAAVSRAAKEPIDMRRFRPNIVVADAAGKAFEETQWAQLCVGRTRFYAVKACARCKVPRLHPETGAEHKGQQPTAALEALGQWYNKEAYFGTNLCHSAEAPGSVVRVGDAVALETQYVKSLVPE